MESKSKIVKILLLGSLFQKECSNLWELKQSKLILLHKQILPSHNASQLDSAVEFLSNIIKKNGLFDYIFCVGSFLGEKSANLQEFRDYISLKKKVTESCKIRFIDSSPLIGPFMHSKRDGFEILQNVQFLGRSGVVVFPDGLRVAFLSGKDNDLFEKVTGETTENQQNANNYTGNYFTNDDIQKIMDDYDSIIENDSEHKGVDLFICCQWPMNITKFTNDDFPKMYYNLSTKISKVANYINPRYIVTSSCDQDIFYQRCIYVNNEGFSSRFISLSAMTNKNSSTTFKQKYVHALSLNPLCNLSLEDLKEKELAAIQFDTVDQLQSKLPPGMRNPFYNQINLKSGHLLSQELLLKEKLELGNRLMKENKIQKVNLENSDGEEEIRDEVFFSNLPKRCDYNDLKDFMSKFGEITEVDMKYDNRTNRFRGFAIIKFKDSSAAEQAVEDSNKYRIQGKRVSIDYNKKKGKAKASEKTGDETCWFCFNNKDIERHLIVTIGKDLYVALPKGPVVDHHFLIIPKNHIASAITLAQNTKIELANTKKMLIDYITEHDKNDYFVFERNLPLKFENAMHMNIQVISIPPCTYDLDDRVQYLLRESMLDFQQIEGTIEEAFEEEEAEGQQDKFYLYFEYPGLRTAKGRQNIKLLVKIQKDGNTNHLMQIGRAIVCELLGAREKANWKACAKTKDEEIQIVEEVGPVLEKFKI